MRVGLTGGIGSGKSTVSAMLAHKGAGIVDADEIARRIVEPGSPVLARLSEEFGDDIVLPNGRLNRQLLADRAFADDRATRHLNEITRPAIREIAEAEITSAETRYPIAVYEMPLLVETGQVSLVDIVVVVDAPAETQVQRATARGLDEADVRRRMEQQASRDDRTRAADHVIDNGGSLESTRAQVDALWTEWTS